MLTAHHTGDASDTLHQVQIFCVFLAIRQLNVFKDIISKTWFMWVGAWITHTHIIYICNRLRKTLTLSTHIRLDALGKSTRLTLVSTRHVHNALATFFANIFQIPWGGKQTRYIYIECTFSEFARNQTIYATKPKISLLTFLCFVWKIRDIHHTMIRRSACRKLGHHKRDTKYPGHLYWA